MALVNANGGVVNVVEFLSYEGTFTAAGGPAAGLTSVDIGVDQDPPPASGETLQKDAAGWYGPAPASFGACNERPGNRVSIVGRNAVSDPPLPVGFQDQLFASLLGPSNDTIPTTFAWLVETPALASIDADGVLTALGAGTVVVRVTAGDGTSATISLPTAMATASTTASYQGNAEFGAPADADASDDVIVTRDQYVASYNPTRGTPNWVSYNLEASHFGALDRCDCFTFDPALPAGVVPYTTAAYTGAGAFHGFGIDRGHLARSFDRTSGALDNATTFYFTNIIPQAADLNQGPWAVLENQLGDSARFGEREVYVITGVAGSRLTLKNEGRLVMPASVWKVALILPRDHGLDDVDSYDDVTLIAVLMPNEAGVRNVSWETYRTTVDAIEAASGYDLLALVPNRLEHVLETGVAEVERAIDGLVAAGTLDPGNANALRVQLEAAAEQIARGNAVAGLNQIKAFQHAVDALVRSGRLTEEEADVLRAAVAVVAASAM